MAPRTFARRFKAETGTTPYHWLTNQRVMLAERMLEESDETIERIATKVGVQQRHRVPAPLRPAARHQPPAVPPDLQGSQAGRGVLVSRLRQSA